MVVLERRASLNLACSQYAEKPLANGFPVLWDVLLLGYFERKLGSGCISLSINWSESVESG